MSATIVVFPVRVLPRAAMEAMAERMIELLDAADLPTVDCEPDVDESSDDGETETWQEWHTRSIARQLRPGHSTRLG